MDPIQFSFETRTVKRLFPLTISRGTTGEVKTLFVHAELDGFRGTGEGMRCYGALLDIDQVCPPLLADLVGDVGHQSIREIYEEGVRREIPMPGLAALDVALWDLKAKQAGMPLYKLLGLPRPTVPTSVTIGIEPREVVLERVPIILKMTGAKILKIKLGSPEGREFDKQVFLSAKEAAEPFGITLRVDANGGWQPGEAIDMCKWLDGHGCDTVEQPLPVGQEAEVKSVKDASPIPVFLDESIRTSHDVVRFAHVCDGVNLKLMKSGGITEGLALLQTAKAFGLKTMIGCMSDTSIAIAGGVALSGLCDQIDLDNHTNLDPDPATGLSLVDGVVLPPEVPGHGAVLSDAPQG